VPDLLTVPTAELAIGLLLAAGRHIVAGDSHIRAAGFAGWRPALYGLGLEDATVGIVGLGKVGQAIAERLAPFGSRLLGFDTRQDVLPPQLASLVTLESLQQLLERSDYVILALPLTPSTLHIIDRAAVARMKPGALLINPARGSLVDEAALADAIEAGRLAGYAADVFECEDWSRADRPASIEPRLVAQEARVVLTPHLGSAVEAVRRNIELAAARSIIEALAGREPSGAVNKPLQRPRST
jgi:phosphonate dehydrogenase